MHAVREFRYFDFAERKSVVVPAGAEIDTARLAANKVDVDKMVRTKYVERESLTVTPKKRGRPRKEG